MKKIILFFFMTILWSCGNGDATVDIAALEKTHADTPTTEVKEQLIAGYQQEISSLDNADAYADMAHKKAVLEMDLNQYEAAETTLATAIQKFPDANKTNENLRLWSSLLIYHRYPKDFSAAKNAVQKMYPSTEQLQATFSPIIKNLGETMLDEKSGQWNRVKVRDYISMSRLYAAIKVKDDQAQKSLYTAANMAIAVKKYDEALTIYDYVLAHPDDFSKSSTALFLKGFTYDEHLKNFEEARKYYEDFLEKYPNDGYASSVKASLKNLGKTAEEIIESFE